MTMPCILLRSRQNDNDEWEENEYILDVQLPPITRMPCHNQTKYHTIKCEQEN